jgi:hypothetical protein
MKTMIWKDAPKRTKMPCFAQDVLTLVAIAAERLNDMDQEDIAAARRALIQFSDEMDGPEADFLKRVASAITLAYEGQQ